MNWVSHLSLIFGHRLEDRRRSSKEVGEEGEMLVLLTMRFDVG